MSGKSSENRVVKLAFRAVVLALALILSYVESLIPFHFSVPGCKIGLANLVIVFALYRFKAWEAGLISLLRVVIVSLLFGSFVTFCYGFFGALVSFLLMAGLKKTGLFHETAVSVAGGVFHNVAQILVAAVLMQTGAILYYIPVLLLAGIVTGALIGLLAAVLVKRIPKEVR